MDSKTEVRRALPKIAFHLLLVGVAVATFGNSALNAQLTSYFSFEGRLIDGSGEEDFLFNLGSNVLGSEPLSFRTYHHDGGTNAAGDAIASGSFDPVLTLFNGGQIFQNDDGPGLDRDSLIRRVDLADPFPSGNYRLNLASSNPGSVPFFSPWAVDLAGPPDMSLTDFGGTQSFVDSLKFGTLCAGFCARDPALVSLGPGGFPRIPTLVVAPSGDARLELNNTSFRVDVATLGEFANGSGTAVLQNNTEWRGTDDILNATPIVRVGDAGDGTMQVGSGSSAYIEEAFVAVDSSATGGVTVTGTGSEIMILRTLKIGDGGTGSLRVEAGGLVSKGITFPVETVIGDDATSEGTAEVANSGSQWVTEDLIIGNSGTGTLIIEDGASVSTMGDAFIARNAGSNGTALLRDFFSQWTVTGSLYVGGSDTAAGGTGLLRLDDPLTTVTVGSTAADVFKLWPTGTLSTASATINGPLQNAGTVVINGSFATLTVNGEYDQASTGILDLDIGGTDPGDIDRLIVSGDATLDGHMAITSVDGFAPTQGQEFNVLTVVGSLDIAALAIEFVNLLPGFNFTTSSDGTVLTITALNDGELADRGDVNSDGDINGLDVAPFVDVLLNSTTDLSVLWRADMNDDNHVNGLDVDPFVAAVVGGDTHQIPEPSTLLLALIALGMVGGWRKWKRAT